MIAVTADVNYLTTQAVILLSQNDNGLGNPRARREAITTMEHCIKLLALGVAKVEKMEEALSKDSPKK